MKSITDVLGLANRPGVADCVSWSDDGVLAVAAGHSVVLLNPGDLAGPRAFASQGRQCDTTVLLAPGAPAKPTADAHHELVNLRLGAFVSQYPLLQLIMQIRGLAWSPSGCSASAGCLLATVTNDHQVLVYGPPSGPTSEWQQVANLSQLLLQHLDATSWRNLTPVSRQQPEDAAPAAAAATAGEEGTLRLRGGAKRKLPAARKPDVAEQQEEAPVHRPEATFSAAVGQAVEVMTAEEGLEGCWFCGSLEELQGGWALVAYSDLREAEEQGGGVLREWFPLPGQRQGPVPGRPSSSGGAPLRAHATEEGPMLRPSPPVKKSGVGGARRVGDVCDALIDDGWWEGCRVVELQDKGAQVLVEISGERHVVDRAHTRRCLLFQGGQWEVLVAPASAAVEQAAPAEPAAAAEPVAAAEEPPARKRRRRAGGSKTVGSGVEPEPLPDNAQQQQQQEREQGQEQEEEELAAAGDEQQPKAKTKAKKAEKQGNLQQLAAAVAGGGSPAPAAQPGKKGGHGPRKGPPPSYDVPDGFDPSVLPPVDTSSIKAARVSLPLAFCRRFLLLRRLVPDEDLPEYETTSSHLKGVDAQLIAQTAAELMHVHGEAMAALSGTLTAKWLNTEGRQRLRSCWDRTRNKLLGGFKVDDADASEPSSESEDEARQPSGAASGAEQEAASGDDEGGGRLGPGGGPRRQRRRSSTSKALGFPPHQLPEGFSWRDLPGVDPSNDASAKSSLVLAAVRRFLTLRQEYPSEDLPVYEMSSNHLRGRDAWLVERVTRELSTAYSQLFSDVKWDTKQFQTYWCSRLRSKWDRVSGQLEQGFVLAPEEVNPGSLLAVGASAEAAAGPASPEGAAVLQGPCLQNRSSAKKGPRRPGGAGARSSSARASPGMGGDAGSDGEDGGSLGGSQAEEMLLRRKSLKKKEKKLSAATVMQRMHRSGPSKLDSQAYQLRLLGTSTLSCAWSPVVAAQQPVAPASTRQQQQQQQQQEQEQPQQAVQSCCFLAVGAKAGRVWLWRYRLPQHYHLPPHDGEPGGGFELVGCLAGSPGAWVSSLAWQLLPGADGASASLVLVVGCSDGAVLLYGSEVQQLASLPDGLQQQQQEAQQQQQQGGQQQDGQQQAAALPSAMDCWCVPVHPDLLTVSTLAVHLLGAAGSADSRLLLAAGKSVGSLAVWRSSALGGGSTAGHRQALARGGVGAVLRGVQGTRDITGLSWLPAQAQQAGVAGPLLLACSRDGAMVCRQLTDAAGGSLALLPVDGCPQPAGGRRRKREVSGHCAFGLALSPCGTFSAVARLSLSPATEIVQSLQVHERVVQGLLQLDRVAGPGAPLEAQAALTAAVNRLTAAPASESAAELLPASGVWEIAALLRLHAKWQPTGAGAQADTPALVPPLAAAVLQQLEQPVMELQAAAGEDFLPRMGPRLWRGLQLATALRHVLDPARILAQQQQRSKLAVKVVSGAPAMPAHMQVTQPQQQRQQQGQQRAGVKADQEGGEGGAQGASPQQQQQCGEWQMAMKRNEMLLMQRHIHSLLSPLAGGEGEGDEGAGAASQLSHLLMADWITLNAQHPLLLPDMFPLAGSVYLKAQEEIPDPVGMPARETSTLFHVPIAVAGVGVAAATVASLDGAWLARCPASLLLCESRPHWACRCCRRSYRQVSQQGPAVGADKAGSQGPPACIFCGVLLGMSSPAVLFSPPCCS